MSDLWIDFELLHLALDTAKSSTPHLQGIVRGIYVRR